LDPELLNSQVSKYAKFVTQLEKGLPPNSVVPQLKSKVEKMKEKVSLDEIISETPGQSFILEANETKARNSSLFKLPLQREEATDKFSYCRGTNCILFLSWANHATE